MISIYIIRLHDARNFVEKKHPTGNSAGSFLDPSRFVIYTPGFDLGVAFGPNVP